MGTVKRVAVIGAGASGLTAIKCCLDEGLEPVCFEKSGYIGGLWHYTEDVVDGQVKHVMLYLNILKMKLNGLLLYKALLMQAVYGTLMIRTYCQCKKRYVYDVFVLVRKETIFLMFTVIICVPNESVIQAVNKIQSYT